MKLSEVYSHGRFGLSFEMYPPKTEEGLFELYQHLGELVRYSPSFVTCTYGAGGSTRRQTLEIVDQVRQTFHVPVGAHLTCMGASVELLREYLREAAQRGVSYIVALRGDPPRDKPACEFPEGGLRHANELVALIRAEFPEFGVAVAGYPETHPEAPSRQVDMDNLKRKVDAGADVIFTQLFYDNADFFRFRDRCVAMGISVPIVPGILPITNLAQVKRLTSQCGTSLPPELLRRLDAHVDNPQGQFDVGVYHATRQVEDLVHSNVPGVHFYVLNRSRAAATILRILTLPEAPVHRKACAPTPETP